MVLPPAEHNGLNTTQLYTYIHGGPDNRHLFGIGVSSFRRCIVFAIFACSYIMTGCRHSLCRCRVLAVAKASVRLSVRLSVTPCYSVKTIQARITKFSPLAPRRTLIVINDVVLRLSMETSSVSMRIKCNFVTTVVGLWIN